jgi:rubrerythrin
MVKEEQSHEQTLRKQLDQLENRDGFNNDALPGNPDEFSEAVLTKEVAEEISGAGYEAAAISAAMTLEVSSVDFYTESSEAALDTDEKKFFNYLSNWESSHLRVLSSLNREILEKALQDGLE